MRGIEFDTRHMLHCLLGHVGGFSFTVLTWVALMFLFVCLFLFPIVLMLQACLPWLDCCWHAVFCIQINCLVWLKYQIVVSFALFCTFTNDIWIILI